MNRVIRVQINFFGPYIRRNEIDRILAQGLPGTAFTFKRDLLERFFDLPCTALSAEILERYAQVTTRDLHIDIAPYTSEISERLLIPMRAAKKHYCLGDYSSTIACCGIIGEMLAILVWRIHETKLSGRTVTEADEKGLFGRKFEKLEQESRLRVLRTFGYTTGTQHDKFMTIKDKRNRYLHLWSIDLRSERADAFATFRIAVQLFKQITGIGVADAGTVRVNPRLLTLFRDRE